MAKKNNLRRKNEILKALNKESKVSTQKVDSSSPQTANTKSETKPISRFDLNYGLIKFELIKTIYFFIFSVAVVMILYATQDIWLKYLLTRF